MYDTIIIGAGMSGLAAGIRLAHFDQRVCILERHTTIGGMNSFYRLRGRNYDVGLHAVTNYAPKGARRGPLPRLLRQLRFQWDEFGLAEQLGSRVAFPGVDLKFNNDVELLVSQIAEAFPDQKDNFQELVRQLIDYDDLGGERSDLWARPILSDIITDPLLVEMLFCPCAWYGNPCQHDMRFGLFSTLFRSIYLEGFARPYEGVRRILRLLVRRYKQLGGDLKLRSGVSRIVVEDGQAVGVELDDGTELQAKRVASSAGICETLRLCGHDEKAEHYAEGRLSFAESISVLDRSPRALGHDDTIVFFNDSDKFDWRSPEDDLCDLRTGVLCSPNNFQYDPLDGDLPEGVMRITSLASFDGWMGLNEEQYRLEKLRWYDRIVSAAVKFSTDFRSRVIETDMFTPKTIQRFTWREGGAVYGAPDKQPDGTTPVENLFLCGTDQGMLGIIGAIASGIGIANRYLLRA